MLGLIQTAELLCDSYSVAILQDTHYAPKTVVALARANDIPIAGAYRRVRQLVELGVLAVHSKTLTQQGKRQALYISTVRNMDISFPNGRLQVRIDYRNGRSQLMESDSAVTIQRPSDSGIAGILIPSDLGAN